MLSSVFSHREFLLDFIRPALSRLQVELSAEFPKIYVILGNDDGCAELPSVNEIESGGLWNYVHNRFGELEAFDVFGYSFVPPTPFFLKDWEKYDVSRFADPGCIPPEEGVHTLSVSHEEIVYSTIEKDLNLLTNGRELGKTIGLFHTPPYQTKLDRAALDGRKVEEVELDLNIGSIAVRRFIEKQQPFLTLHGHVHESARLTGAWQDSIGRTTLLSAAHDGPELALVSFELENPQNATRDLLL